MSNSGVVPDQECIEMFDTLKMKKTMGYIIYDIKEVDGKHTIKVHQTGDKNATFQDFREKISEMGKPCYGVVDFRGNVCFVMWCPDNAKVKDKMITASSKDAFKKKLVGLKKDFEMSELSELTEEEFMQALGPTQVQSK